VVVLFDVLFTKKVRFMKREIFMNTSIDAAITSALSVANLVADALLFPHVAVEIAQQPQRVASVRGLDTQSVIASARIVEKGRTSAQLGGVWF
jgi:hypothetical protein